MKKSIKQTQYGIQNDIPVGKDQSAPNTKATKNQPSSGYRPRETHSQDDHNESNERNEANDEDDYPKLQSKFTNK